jgi:o-succinylbenzoate synthase
LLTLSDELGFAGQGEVAPLPGYSDDSLEQSARALEHCRSDALETVNRLDRLLLARAVEHALPLSTPAVRFGVETALLDLLARRLGLPLHRALQTLFALARPCSSVNLAALIALEPGDAQEGARRAVSHGYSTLKVKIGHRDRFATELAALAALRRAVGALVRLRLDANRAFTELEAGSRLEQLATIGPEFVEEPLARGAPWPRHPPVPLAVDESLRDGLDLSPELRLQHGVLAAVIKPGVVGGLLAAFELASRAERAGIVPVVSHAFEGPVGFAASCELALALGSRSHADGLGPHTALDGWGAPRAAAVSNARLVPHGESGLGLPTLSVPT